MREVTMTLAGEDVRLCLTGDAYLTLLDRYGDDYISKIVDAPAEKTRDALTEWYGVIRDTITLLAEQDQLARSALGYPAETVPSIGDTWQLLSPADITHCLRAIDVTLAAGISREFAPNKAETTDLILAELEKKTKSA